MKQLPSCSGGGAGRATHEYGVSPLPKGGDAVLYTITEHQHLVILFEWVDLL
jgi:hypothetical protein